MSDSVPLLWADQVAVQFLLGGGWMRGAPRILRAVDGVSLEIAAGETLGVVGESGCGKSTLARALLRLVELHSGQVLWRGEDMAAWGAEQLRQQRRQFQMVFQDPLASLDPRMSVRRILEQPLDTFRPDLSGAAQGAEIERALDAVGLAVAYADRYPHELSGGQAQRIGIARAMLPGPDLVVCDEAVSALDVTTQAQILDLLAALQRDRGVAFLFISHNLAVIRQVSRRVLVLYLGAAVESAPAEALFGGARHPYTAALIAAVPVPDPAIERHRPRLRLTGEPPSPGAPPSGCRFRARCPLATAICTEQVPILRAVAPGHLVACHHAG